ncbi:uncharacterized protein LOC130860114 [Hippopotamus amphibius kiboko]|uniref:uncharacterized protein LOC130860114 n=1 Tax=Hippopotamus amphibius kiboko TaxID=575201 RepID=UPI0025940A59|nr:uncharacterized protein LOC130860114 [Hippopotamus amphibius kiboko]
MLQVQVSWACEYQREPFGHAPSANSSHWRWDCLQSARVGASAPETAMLEDRQPRDSGGCPLHTRCPAPSRSPWWQVRSVFLIDTGATGETVSWFLMLGLSCKSCTMTGVGGKSFNRYFTGPLSCQFEWCWVSHVFLVGPGVLPHYWGKTWAPSGPYDSLGGPKQPLILTLAKADQQEERGPVANLIPSTSSEPCGKRDKGVPGRAINAQPAETSLKPEAAYPNKRQYLVRLEAKKGLQLLREILKTWLLGCPVRLNAIPLFCLGNQMGAIGWCQTSAVKEAVVPIRPLVAIPYNVVAQVPENG